MKQLLLFVFLLLFIEERSFSQNTNCPPNIDFELGDFSNWDCFTGSTFVQNGNNVISLFPSPPTPGRHEIITAANSGLDPYGNFPTLCPYGGNNSVKLGNNSTSSQAEGISYTFQIPPSADTFSLTYYYAVVFEDPNHSTIEQPRFFVTAYDVLTGALINCASYNYIATGSIPGFKVSPTSSGVLYKEWTPASIDFSGLSGRTVRLEFKTADCTLGGHFGYAYLDVGTGCGGVMAVGAYCISTNSVTLNAPYGFQTYTWYNSNYSAVVGNTRTVSLTPPPPVNTMFHVDMIPYPGYGCRDTADAILTVLPVPDTPVALSQVYYCQFDAALALTAIPDAGNELLWYTTATGGTPSYNALIPSTAASGSFDYYVSQKKLFGCEGPRKKITVNVSPTPVVSFSINNSRQCQNSNAFVFSSTSSNINASTTYEWAFGDGQKAFQNTANHVYTNAGNYVVTLKVLNSAGCARQINQSVQVIPKPVAVYSFNNLICENQTPIVLQNNSYVPGGLSTINSWWWQIGSSIVTSQSPASFTYTGGILPVKLVVTSTEGCRSDTTHTDINVHYSPLPKFSYGPLLCDNEIIQFKDLSKMPAGSGTDYIVKWNWWYDNMPSSSISNPSALFTMGQHSIKLVAESDKGCNFNSADSVFVIHPKPGISLTISDSCALRNIVYTAGNTTSVAVNKWLWDFGKGLAAKPAVQVKNYSLEGYNPVTLIGQTIHNCKDTLIRPFTIFRNRSKAQQDTIVAMDEVVQLATSDTINMLYYKWTPDIGLSSTTISNPRALYSNDQVYELNTLTVQGCDSYSRILIRRYKGPELYVPNAFTPNSDGVNDVLRVFPVGIKSFEYFSVYNRKGQLIFTTTNYHSGWDGFLKGLKADQGNYVWIAKATDYRGNVLFRKGNVLLLQ
jgi:gliding motility-associated-like protein